MDAIAEAEVKWGIKLKRVSGDEYAGPCPFCPDGGEDRFHVWQARGNYWCRVCDKKGFVDDGVALSPEERRQREIERRLAEVERKQQEHARRLSILERMAQEVPQAEAYHRNLDIVPGAREWWQKEGLFPAWQDFFTVGYCGRCPTDAAERASYTIPVVDGGQLVNIQHRLAQAPNGDKYRPHMAGLGSNLFNTRHLDEQAPGVLLVEGSKKAMVLEQYGFPAVAIAGCRNWKAEWTARFAYLDPVTICLDPDAMPSAERLAAFFPGRARIVALPCKPDDFFSVYHGTQQQFQEFVKKARPV